jgi:hypothetical protein
MRPAIGGGMPIIVHPIEAPRPRLHPVIEGACRLIAGLTAPATAAEQVERARRLQPRPEDYALVFRPDVVERARRAYGALWRRPAAWPIRDDQTILRVAMATAAQLADGTGTAGEFPGGYREAAHLLRGDSVWVSGELVKPGDAHGLALDGFVPIGGRWCWFPRPWLYVPARRTRPLAHWDA